MSDTAMTLLVGAFVLLASSGGATGLMALELGKISAKGFRGADAWMNPQYLFRAHRENFPESILRRVSLSTAVIGALLAAAAAILDSK